MAYLMQQPSPAFEAYAFSVVTYYCASYTFAHELGHLQGANHDRLNATSGAFPYSFGYQSPDAAFRTLMAYDCDWSSHSCIQVNHWSNPEGAYDNQPTGVSRTAPDADDAKAGYRPLPQTPYANGWIRLSWPNYNDDLVASGEIHPTVGNLDTDAPEELILGLASFPRDGGWVQILDDAFSGFAPWPETPNAGGWVRVN